MSDILSLFLLLSVPAVPLLLAFPALFSRLPWRCHIALLPAVILLAFPTDLSVELPWLLFGSGLGIDGASRLLFGTSVVLWIIAVTFLRMPKGQSANNRFTTFFLLTLAANLGAILATDMVGFFSFSTLMGYAFYALLVMGGEAGPRRAGRIYLAFLILADLVLFEALLIAAATSDDLGIGTVRQAMAQSPSMTLYMTMVLIGFMAKAGIWPMHFWLPLAFRWSRPAVALLVGGVPVTIGLLGAVRWLPLGEVALPALGSVIQGLGVVAMLYAVLSGMRKARLNFLPTQATMLATGLFTTAIGMGLSGTAAWERYGNWADHFIALLGLGVAVLVVASNWLEVRYRKPTAPANYRYDSSLWIERWSSTIVAWVGMTGFSTLPRWRAAWLGKIGRLWLVICAWQDALTAAERTLLRWEFAITLFLLLGIAMVFVGAPPWR